MSWWPSSEATQPSVEIVFLAGQNFFLCVLKQTILLLKVLQITFKFSKFILHPYLAAHSSSWREGFVDQRIYGGIRWGSRGKITSSINYSNCASYGCSTAQCIDAVKLITVITHFRLPRLHLHHSSVWEMERLPFKGHSGHAGDGLGWTRWS